MALRAARRRCLGLLALLLAHSCPPSGVAARVVDDAAFGITRYDFRGVWEGVPGLLTVYLRPICIGRTLHVRGAMGVTTVKLQADTRDRYTAPASLLDHAWALRLVDRSTNSSTPVRVYKTVDRGERTLSYSQLEAALPAPRQLELFVDGAPWRHELYLPECALASDDPEHPLAALPGSLLNDRHWAVVMAPRVLPAAAGSMAQYAEAVLGHLAYHRGLGFAGTLLLTDLHQAAELAAQPRIAAALAADELLLWPWEHEQPQEASSHALYWQVPRYQLVAVAGWGRAMRAAFLDPDDFIVLPGGQPVTAAGSCLGLQGSQANLLHHLHWQAGLAPGDEEQQASSSSSSSGGDAGAPSGHSAAAAVLRLARFDAQLLQEQQQQQEQQLESPVGRRWWARAGGAALQVSSCPVRDGGLRASRRPVIAPHEVVSMRVYTAAARGGRLNGPTTPPACAFILHVTNTLAPAQPLGDSSSSSSGGLTDARWQPHGAGEGAAGGTLVLASGEQLLPRRRPLLECQPRALQRLKQQPWRQGQQQQQMLEGDDDDDVDSDGSSSGDAGPDEDSLVPTTRRR